MGVYPWVMGLSWYLVTRFWDELNGWKCEWCELYRVETEIWITWFLDILEGVMLLLWL